MRTIWVLCLLLLVADAVALGQATVPASPRGRLSADGVPLPPASEKRPVDIQVDGIGRAIGSLPEEVVSRVFVSDKTPAPLKARGVSLPPGTFYGIDKFNADVVELELVDGRVQSLKLHIKAQRKQQLKSIVSGLFPSHGHATMDNKETFHSVNPKQRPLVSLDVHSGNKDQPGLIRVWMTKPDWYVATHPDLDKAIADALVSRRVIRGMTREHADLAMGKGKVIRESEGELEIEWKVELVYGVTVNIYGGVNPGPRARTLHVTRAVFRDGFVQDVFRD